MESVIRIRRALPPVHVRRRDLFAYPDFRFAMSGQMCSQMSDALTTFTLAEVLVFGPLGHASTSTLVSTMCSAAVPLLFAGPIAGRTADRVHRKHILMYGHFIRALLTLVAAVSILDDGRAVGFVSLALLTGLTRILYTARVTSIPQLVRRHELVGADSTSLILSVVAGALGAGLGSVLASTTPLIAFAIAALGQLVAAMLYRSIAAELGGGRSSKDCDLKTLLAHLVRPRTKFAVLATTAHRLLLGLSLASVAMMIDARVQLSTAGSVVVLGSGAVGSFLGSMCAEWATETFPRRTIALLSFGLTALSMAIAAIIAHPFVGLGSLLAGAFLFQVLRVRSDASIQANVEPGALGQVFATYDIIYNLAFIIGGIAGVSLAPVTPYSVVVGAIVVAYIALAVMFATVIKDGKEVSADSVPHHTLISA